MALLYQLSYLGELFLHTSRVALFFQFCRVMRGAVTNDGRRSSGDSRRAVQMCWNQRALCMLLSILFERKCHQYDGQSIEHDQRQYQDKRRLSPPFVLFCARDGTRSGIICSSSLANFHDPASRCLLLLAHRSGIRVPSSAKAQKRTGSLPGPFLA